MKTFYHSLVLFFCLFTFQVSAQLSIGVKGGYIKAWEDYGDVDLPENAQIHVEGFQVSAMAYYKLSKHISFGIEPGYAQRGAACVPGWEPIFEGDTKLLLNYVELPLMAKAYFPLFKDKLELFGKAGYGASMIASANEAVTILGSEQPPVKAKINLEEDSRLNRFDHGAYGSLGVAVNFGKNQVFFESGYYHGFKDADPSNVSKNRSLQYSLGYTIRL